MMDLQFDGEVDLGPDDELLIGDDIRHGGIVYFDRVDDRKVVMRTLAEEDLDSFSGKAYRAERGDQPGTVKFTQLK